jgi:hypothetical protein
MSRLHPELSGPDVLASSDPAQPGPEGAEQLHLQSAPRTETPLLLLLLFLLLLVLLVLLLLLLVLLLLSAG